MENMKEVVVYAINYLYIQIYSDICSAKSLVFTTLCDVLGSLPIEDP